MSLNASSIHHRSVSCLRLFLSIDIAGSTALKNRKNHQILLGSYDSHLALLRKFIERIESSDQEAAIEEVILQQLSAEDLDWSRHIQTCFSEFHASFCEDLKNCSRVAADSYPWKAVGDELIYAFPVVSREDLTRIVTAFVLAFRRHDCLLCKKKNPLRVKATGWVAGFPVRNRMVELPMPQVYLKSGTAFPYPREDFLGPDMDTGFRLQRCTWPGAIAISMELAELLGAPQVAARLRTAIVGWKVLKGVWENRPYPVIWVAPGIRHPRDSEYEPFPPGSESECPFIEKWRQEGAPSDASALLPKIVELRDGLPPSLGLVEPYIAQENDIVPDEHRMILRIIDKLEERSAGVGGRQETPPGKAMAGKVDKKAVDKKLVAVKRSARQIGKRHRRPQRPRRKR